MPLKRVKAHYISFKMRYWQGKYVFWAAFYSYSPELCSSEFGFFCQPETQWVFGGRCWSRSCWKPTAGLSWECLEEFPILWLSSYTNIYRYACKTPLIDVHFIFIILNLILCMLALFFLEIFAYPGNGRKSATSRKVFFSLKIIFCKPTALTDDEALSRKGSQGDIENAGKLCSRSTSFLYGRGFKYRLPLDQDLKKFIARSLDKGSFNF